MAIKLRRLGVVGLVLYSALATYITVEQNATIDAQRGSIVRLLDIALQCAGDQPDEESQSAKR